MTLIVSNEIAWTDWILRLTALFVTSICIILGLRKLSGRRLRIGRIRGGIKPGLYLRFEDIRYTQNSTPRNTAIESCTFTISSIDIRFHLPRPSYPRWASIVSGSVFYSTDQCRVSLSDVLITLWIFPYAFRFTAGPWVDVVLNNFRLQIYRSWDAPEWVQGLRRNLVGTIVKGEILRCDDFSTRADFNNKPRPSDFVDGDAVADMPERDDMRITAYAKGYHVKNWQNRIYSFQSIDAQIRKNWDSMRGTCVMVVEDAKWVKVHEEYERIGGPINTWRQLFLCVVHLPITLYLLSKPQTSITNLANIYIPNADITFDNFRFRDGELIKQGAFMAEEEMFWMGNVVQEAIPDLLTSWLRA